MTNIPEFSGVLPAIPTPLDADERFLPKSLEALLERVYGQGVHGIYVCGQTGEGLQQSVAQRQQVAEVAMKNSPAGKQVIVHIGGHTNADAVTLARHAGRIGAHAVSSLPPGGNYTFEEIRGYYQAVAAACDLPLLIYYFPSIAPALRTADQMFELLRIPNVVGLKFTDSDMFRLWTLRRSGAVIYNGNDDMLVAGLLMGANGGIGSTYNLMPAQFAELFRCARASEWDAAKRVQDDINELITVVVRYPVQAAVKSLLTWSGIECGPAVSPRRNLTAAEHVRLREDAAATKLGQELFAAAVR